MPRIAIVDDDRSVRRSMARLLRSNGYRCVAYDCAESVLADPATREMDCILADIELYGMTGIELRDRLIELGSQVPLIFFTAHSVSGPSLLKDRVGATPCLTKPVDESLLLTSIHGVMHMSSGLTAS